jgi:hypothetical protein
VIFITILLCGGPLVVVLAVAQDKPPPPKTDLGFDASKIPPPNVKKGKAVARVLDQYLYRDDLGGNLPREDSNARQKLQGLILVPLLDRFVAREKIVATAQEIDQTTDYLRRTYRKLVADGLVPAIAERDNDQANRDARTVAEDLAVQWKCCRALYSRYGGPVIFQQGNPLEPVGAYRRFLEDVERGGAFEVYDPEDRKAFYDYFTRDHGHWVVPKELINYDTPWWLQTDEEKSKWPRPARQAE